jgi:DNA-binding XRE family transcriptional regulator
MTAVMPLPKDRLNPQRDHNAEAVELRRMRAVLGLTQVEMARLVDVSPQTYHRWEKGDPCQYAALELIRCWVRERGVEETHPRPRPRKRGA